MRPSQPVHVVCLCAFVVLALADTGHGLECSEDAKEPTEDHAFEVSLLQIDVSMGRRESELSMQGSVAGIDRAYADSESVLGITDTAQLLLDRLAHWRPVKMSSGRFKTLLAGSGIAGLALLAMFGPALFKGTDPRSPILHAKPSPSLEPASGPCSPSEQLLPQSNVASASEQPKLRTVLFFVIGHCLSASTLTVVNKWAMQSFHPPGAAPQDHHKGYIWMLSLIQFVTAALVAKLVGVLGIARCDHLEMKQALAYFPAAGMFMITIVAGNSVMNYANVSTFVVLRSLVPLPCALMETVIYKDPLPPPLSWAALCIVSCGALVYGASMGGFEMSAITWAMVFLVCMPVDGLLIKHAISSTSLSPWGRVYYNNALASLPLVFFVFFFEVPTWQAFIDMTTALLSPEASVAVAVSCLVGISLSFFQMTARYYISATAFMVLGVVNKFLTVFWNELFIDRDSNFALMGVLLALIGAVAWQLSMGNGSVKVRAKSEVSDSSAIFAMIGTVICLVVAGFVQHFNMATSQHLN